MTDQQDGFPVEDPYPPVVGTNAQGLRKRVVWDVVPDESVVDALPFLDMIPASDEVEDMERVAAVNRRSDILPLFPSLTMMSSFVADAIRAGMMVEHGHEDVEHNPAFAKELLTYMVFNSVVAILGELSSSHSILLPYKMAMGMPMAMKAVRE